MERAERLRNVQEQSDATAEARMRWRRRRAYYYGKVAEYYRFLIPEGARVLEIGSADGSLLASLKPSRGLGIDASPLNIRHATQHYTQLEFRHGFAENFKLVPHETFDVIILSNLVGHLHDVQEVFENLHQACHPSTRIIIDYYNYLWEPLLELGSRLGLRMRQPKQNWLSLHDLGNLLHLSGFETVKTMRKVIFPLYVPILSSLFNRFVSNLPILRRLCLLQYIVARPVLKRENQNPAVSIIVACKDEKGNIAELVRRIPDFSGGNEIVFVDGGSTDGTCTEIERVKTEFPQKNIHLYHQVEKTGKGGAVRIGFDHAKGDVLIILDADLSVAPEDLPKFYHQLLSGKGELINGTRMVYPMERQAMRLLNIFGNKFFSKAFTFLLEQPIRDTLCGTKALFKSDYQKIAANRAFFGEFDPFGDFDLLFGAAKMNLKILEVPVRYYERHYGTTKIKRFRHGFLLLGMCFVAMRKLKFI